MKKTVYTKLPKVFKQKWINALRSKEYKQTTSTLVQEIDKDKQDKPIMGYCCLGVAGKICGLSNDKMDNHGDLTEIYSKDTKRVPKILRFKDDFIVKSPVDILINLNDTKKWSFRRIATWIEKNL